MLSYPNPFTLSAQNTLISKCIFLSGLATTTVRSTVNTMAVATHIQWPQVKNRKKTHEEKKQTLTQFFFVQASPVVQEADSQARAVIILEVPPPPTTTHMQASTVRQGLLTGTTCQIFILSKFN